MPSDNNKPHIRLLDMLQGWTRYIDSVADLDATLLHSMKLTKRQLRKDAKYIAGLYQKAGQLDNPTSNQIKKFIRTKIFTFITK